MAMRQFEAAASKDTRTFACKWASSPQSHSCKSRSKLKPSPASDRTQESRLQVSFCATVPDVTSKTKSLKQSVCSRRIKRQRRRPLHECAFELCQHKGHATGYSCWTISSEHSARVLACVCKANHSSLVQSPTHRIPLGSSDSVSDACLVSILPLGSALTETVVPLVNWDAARLSWGCVGLPCYACSCGVPVHEWDNSYRPHRPHSYRPHRPHSCSEGGPQRPNGGER